MQEYKGRMNSFVLVAGLYVPVAVMAVSAFDLKTEYLVILSTCVLLFANAIGFDAVFQSLQERISASQKDVD